MIYKICSKSLVNSFKLVASKCISKEKSSFAEVIDNALIVNKIQNYMKCKHFGDLGKLRLFASKNGEN